MSENINLADKSQLALWQSYCDKKMECEILQEENQRLTAIATKQATRSDELCEVLECICSYLSEDGLITTGLAKEIVNAQSLLMKLTVSNSNDD